jgi:hypothetical protein
MTQNISYDEWLMTYSPEEAMLETYGEDVARVVATDTNLIWTLVETDYGELISSGYAYVNRIGYYIARVPHDLEKQILVDVS